MPAKKLTMEQWVADLNQEPDPNHIKKNDDGSSYIPISITQTLLDETTNGLWDFEVLRETYGKSNARGYGRMIITCPVDGSKITRGGDAGISLTGDLRMDSPRLEAFILLSCARKFGKRLGRDLNRDRMDAPLPVTDIAKEVTEIDKEFEEMKAKIYKMSKGDAQMTLDGSTFRHHMELKEIIKNKK